MADMIEKGRHWATNNPTLTPRAEHHGMAKITAAQVVEIRELRAAGLSFKKLADRFGLSHTQIQRVAKGIQWKDV